MTISRTCSSVLSPRSREYGSVEALRKEVESGDPYGISLCAARGVDLNCLWADGCGPPALEAASRGHVVALRKLLELRADPLMTNLEGYTTLMAACSSGHDSVVQMLVQCADISSLLSATTRSSKVTAISIAERRLSQAKDDHNVALESLRQAEPCFGHALAGNDMRALEKTVFYRRELEDKRDSTAAMMKRCENVMRHLETCMFEKAAPLQRPGLGTMLGSSLGPVPSTAGTMSILVAAELGEDKVLPTASFAGSRNAISFAKDLSKSSVREESPQQGRFGKHNLALDARLQQSQKVQHKASSDFETKLLDKVQSKRKATHKMQAHKPRTVPALLTAMRALALE